MTQEPNAIPERDVFDPIEILRIIFSNKWKVAAVTLAVGVVTGIITLVVPNTYESSAALILREPKVTVTGEAAPLAIEMLQSLTESAKAKTSVYEKMRAQHKLDGIDYRTFDRTLRTAVDKKVGRELALTPMIRLSVRANKPELAAEIANAWVDEVTSMSTAIYAGDIDSVTSFTMSMFSQADEKLRASEDQYTSCLLRSNVALTSSVLISERTGYGSLFAESLQTEGEVNTKKALLADTIRRLDNQEVNGIWVGDIYADSVRNNRPQEIPKDTTITVQIASLIREIDHGQKQLDAFEESSEIQYKDMLLTNKDKQLEQITQEVVKSQDQLAKAESQYKALEREMLKIPEKITLSKAITDDALWQAYLSGKAPKGDVNSLKTEESNSVYTTVKPTIMLLSGEIQGQKGRVDYYDRKTDTLRTEVSKLANELSHLTSEKEDIKTSVDKDKALLEFLKDEYNGARQYRKTLSRDIASASATLDAKRQLLSDLKASIEKHELEYFQSQNKLEALLRDVENRKQVRISLASKAEEVTLLQISAKQSSRSGVAVLYQAEASPVRISPKRTSAVLASMVAAFALLCVFLVLTRALGDQRSFS